MNNARLPSNPFNITDLRPQANVWTEDLMERKYAGKPLNERTIESILSDRDELRAWDNYERITSENREGAKRVLERLLEQAHKAAF